MIAGRESGVRCLGLFDATPLGQSAIRSDEYVDISATITALRRHSPSQPVTDWWDWRVFR